MVKLCQGRRRRRRRTGRPLKRLLCGLYFHWFFAHFYTRAFMAGCPLSKQDLIKLCLDCRVHFQALDWQTTYYFSFQREYPSLMFQQHFPTLWLNVAHRSLTITETVAACEEAKNLIKILKERCQHFVRRMCVVNNMLPCSIRVPLIQDFAFLCVNTSGWVLLRTASIWCVSFICNVGNIISQRQT